MKYLVMFYSEDDLFVESFGTKELAENFIASCVKCGERVQEVWKGYKIDFEAVEVTTKVNIKEP